METENPQQARIESLITYLIDGKLIAEDGSIKEIDGLLHQLRTSVSNAFDSGAGGGTRTQGSKPPLALNALSILNEIEKDAIYLIPGKFPSLESRLVSILINGDGIDSKRMLKWLESVVDRIEYLFAPRRMVEITRSCPECGVRQVTRTDSAGEVIRSFALQAWVDSDSQAHAHCLNCLEMWDGFEEVASLSRSLSRQSI